MHRPAIAEIVSPDPARHDLLGLRFRSRDGMSRQAMVLMHGAGLDFRAPLYVELARELVDTHDVYLPGLRASGLIQYNEGFRSPQGWAHHRSNAARDDLGRWLTWLDEVGYESIRLVGHSWGALVALASALATPGLGVEIVLVSPLPSLSDLLVTNYGCAREELAALVAQWAALEGMALQPTKAGAPLGVLSVGTIRDLVDTGWELTTLARSWPGPLLVVSGQKEHEQLLAGLDALERCLPGRITRAAIRGAGHFYTHQRPVLAASIAQWAPAVAPPRERR